MIEKKNLIISDEEIEMLGELYKDIKVSSEYKTFEAFVNAKIDEKLKSLHNKGRTAICLH